VRGLSTERLWLRRWRASDRAPFAALNADPAVMQYFPASLSRAESDELIDRFEAGFERDGWGLLALEEQSTRELLGFTGLAHASFEAHFTPAVEIGWRLAHAAWGRGYATEAARRAATFAFETLTLDELVSFTAVGNLRSRAVMQRLGMTHDPREDFDHPHVCEGHDLRRHVLYRLPGPKGRTSTAADAHH
jgi:RimJ/RimL family protein N-acetyltransferase